MSVCNESMTHSHFLWLVHVFKFFGTKFSKTLIKTYEYHHGKAKAGSLTLSRPQRLVNCPSPAPNWPKPYRMDSYRIIIRTNVLYCRKIVARRIALFPTKITIHLAAKHFQRQNPPILSKAAMQNITRTFFKWENCPTVLFICNLWQYLMPLSKLQNKLYLGARRSWETYWLTL